MRPLVFRVENYIPLIRTIGRKHWKKLPNQVKLWIDCEDFIQDGIIFTRTTMPKFNPRMGNKFSTYLFISLNRYFKARVESLGCESRRRTVAAIAVLKEIDVAKRYLYVDGLDGLEALSKLYEEASPLLRSYMDTWFNDRGSTRAVTTSRGFKKAQREFIESAPRYGLTVQVVADILNSNRMGLFRPASLVPELEWRR